VADQVKISICEIVVFPAKLFLDIKWRFYCNTVICLTKRLIMSNNFYWFVVFFDQITVSIDNV